MQRRAVSKRRQLSRLQAASTSTTWVLLLLCLATRAFQPASADDAYLTDQSVVLITGAAGFLGSQVALALHRTYHPRLIVCVDRMRPPVGTQEALAQFETQRQRAFHLLQVLGTKAKFYRADVRPMIPEYYDLGEVPVLDHIFREHEITHILHLEEYDSQQEVVVPHERDSPKAGWMESLLEQMVKQQREGKRVPHLVYASSSDVYPREANSPLSEMQTLSTPNSLQGASKLFDEMICKLYYDQHGLYSVGLRLFDVYGPGAPPGSTIFELAQAAVVGEALSLPPSSQSLQDFVYIDDAVDAMLAALQFRPAVDKPHPVVFNVASGEGASLQQIASLIQDYFPVATQAMDDNMSSVGRRIGSIDRARQYLGYQPLVPLREGMLQTLAWHYDRAFPYGQQKQLQPHRTKEFTELTSRGIVSCLPFDHECLRAFPVFPCASECSHEAQCTPSPYDDVVEWTQALTASCDTVLYTVDLSPDLLQLPSTHLSLHTSSKSFVEGANCNLAFVSASSPLVQSSVSSNAGERHRHGHWILVPVAETTPDQAELVPAGWWLLPKLSPSLFFGSRVQKAIYVDPNVLLDNLVTLLQEASMQPYSSHTQGATALLIGKGSPKDYFAQDDEDEDEPRSQVLPSPQRMVQTAAYRMVHIAVADTLPYGFMDLLDSRWMVHRLKSDDARLFRCDVFGEVVQWDVDQDRSALEFVLGLHDMWSRVIVDGPAWWIGEGVRTVPESFVPRRKLLEEDQDEKEEDMVQVIEKTVKELPAKQERKEDDHLDAAEEDNEDEGEDEDEENTHDDDSTSRKGEVGGLVDEEEGDRRGFAGEDVAQEVVAAEKDRGSSSDHDEDAEFEDEPEVIAEPEDEAEDPFAERDFSAYDTWMGILSASSMKYFVRIVPSSEVGIVSLSDYDRQQATA